jgi:hypothetical protein
MSILIGTASPIVVANISTSIFAFGIFPFFIRKACHLEELFSLWPYRLLKKWITCFRCRLHRPHICESRSFHRLGVLARTLR